MSADSLYKETLLKHYKQRLNKSEDGLAGADITQRGSIPRCGDDIEIGLYLDGDVIEQVKFRGRGCSVCIASTSMMTEAASGQTRSAASELQQQMTAWLQGTADTFEPPNDLGSLSAVRDHPARKKCVLLPWQALANALDSD